MMRWEGVPEISLFIDNTAAFVHELYPDAPSNAAGNGKYVRVQILTPVGVLDRDKELGAVKEMTDIIAYTAAQVTSPGRKAASLPDCCSSSSSTSAPARCNSISPGGTNSPHVGHRRSSPTSDPQRVWSS